MKFVMILVLACISTSIAQAMDANAPGPITLEQVVVSVMEHNPQLSMQNYETQAAAARIRRAQQTRPLEFRFDAENFIGSGAYSGLDKLESTFSLIKILEPANRIASRQGLATDQATLLRNEQDGKLLDILAGAAERFIHVLVDQNRLRIAQDQLKLAQHTHSVVTRRVNAGRSHAAEARQTDIALARAEIELEHAEHELATSRLKLAVMWGETSPKFGQAQAQLFVLPQVESFAQLETLLENNPDLIRFATEERVAQSKLRLAQSRRARNVELLGGIRHFNDSNDAALVFSVGIPFGTHSRAQPKIDEMQFLAEREPLRYEQMYLTLYSSLYELYQELLHARTAYEALSQRIIPEARQAAADYEQGYQRGRFSLLELNRAQGTLLDARLEAVMAAANYHRLKIEIERLTGAVLRSGEQP